MKIILPLWWLIRYFFKKYFYNLEVDSSSFQLMGEYDRMRGFGVNAPTRLAEKLSQDAGIEVFQSFNTCYKVMNSWEKKLFLHISVIQETGLVGTYFVAAPESIDNLIDSVLQQWVWLANSEFLFNIVLSQHLSFPDIDEAAVDRAKRSLHTNLLLMLDGSTPVCEDIGRQLLCYGRRIPTPELHARIESITVQQLRDVCRRVFLEGQVSAAVVGKTQYWPVNEEIHGRLIRMQ